jgi:hypothetical protein
MADQGGISKVTGTNVADVAAQRSVAKPQSRAVTAGGGQGVGRREVPDTKARQSVNLDGKVLNRAAPRGTYLNILV